MNSIIKEIKKGCGLRDFDAERYTEKSPIICGKENYLCKECMARFETYQETLQDEIKSIKSFLERLRGYGCGYHKQLEKQMLNRIKKLNEVLK